MVEELSSQVNLGCIGLGHHQQAGCVLVDAVHKQAEPVVGFSGNGFPSQVISQRIDQRAGIVAMPRVNHQARGLVYDQQVVIFIDDVEGNGLRLDFHATALVGHHKGDDIEWPDFVAGLHDLPVHPDILGVDGQLDTVAGRVRKMLCQVFIDPERALPAVGLQPEMLVHFLLLVVLRQESVVAEVRVFGVGIAPGNAFFR